MRGERGAGGILVLAAVAVLGTSGLVGVSVARALTVRHEVAAAADLAALAAAAVHNPAEGVTPPGAGYPPCDAARRVAAANGVEVVDCVVEGTTVRVEVARDMGRMGVAAMVRSAARAGNSCAGHQQSVP